MRVLALDTTTSRGSAALVEDDGVRVERAGDATRPYAARLPQELLDVLEAATAPLATVDAFAVAVGPGSFTGLRIGIAAMQGLALVAGRPMIAVSILEALGQQAACGAAPGDVVGAWIDAHRGDVYSALYEVASAPSFSLDRIVEVDPPRVGPPDAIAREWAARADGRRLRVIVGDGVEAYPEVPGALGIPSDPSGARPLAGAIGLIALARYRGGGGKSPAEIQPFYVRRPDVEIAREQARTVTPDA